MLVLGLTGLFACGDTAAPTAEEPAPAAATPAAEPAPAPKAIERMAEVVETLDAGTYTYARLTYCGQEAWAAGPKTELTKGQVIKMPEGIGKADFHSESLDRTFDAILFVDWFKPTDETIDCPEPVAANAPKGTPQGVRPAAESGEPQFHGQVKETMAAANYSYVLLDSCGTEEWLAGPQSVVRQGMYVTAKEGALMKDFESKSLGRTFEALWFVPRFKIVHDGPECE